MAEHEATEHAMQYGHQGGKGTPGIPYNQHAAPAALVGSRMGASGGTGWEGGFAQKAAELQGQGVDPGTPTTHQYPLLVDENGAWLVVRQNSTNGVMEWSSGAPPLFIQGQ